MARTVVVVNALGFVEATENDVAEGKDARLLSSLGHRRGHRAHLTKRSSITGVRDDKPAWRGGGGGGGREKPPFIAGMRAVCYLFLAPCISTSRS